MELSRWNGTELRFAGEGIRRAGYQLVVRVVNRLPSEAVLVGEVPDGNIGGEDRLWAGDNGGSSLLISIWFHNAVQTVPRSNCIVVCTFSRTALILVLVLVLVLALEFVVLECRCGCGHGHRQHGLDVG